MLFKIVVKDPIINNSIYSILTETWNFSTRFIIQYFDFFLYLLFKNINLYTKIVYEFYTLRFHFIAVCMSNTRVNTDYP